MTTIIGHMGGVAFHEACRQRVRMLREKYGWSLFTEDELTTQVIGTCSPDITIGGLDQFITGHYMVALYEACSQDSDLDRREQGYQELFRYLYRAAYNRWPDLAQDVTQEALLMVYIQIERCQAPAAFLTFALFKLRAAYRQSLRSQGSFSPLEALPQQVDGSALPESTTIGNERSGVLLDALRRLPERQRQVVCLKFFGGWSDEAIGRKLVITAGHVRVLRFRALEQLRHDPVLQAYFEKSNSAGV
jgi:RNA polymerase sigma factor (sigma-70 family)